MNTLTLMLSYKKYYCNFSLGLYFADSSSQPASHLVGRVEALLMEAAVALVHRYPILVALKAMVVVAEILCFELLVLAKNR